jgi:hypothetical protein
MRKGEHMFGSWSFLELCRAGFSCLTAITAGTSPSQSQQHACAAGAPHSEGIRPASQNCVISSSSYAFGESLSLGNAIHSKSAQGMTLQGLQLHVLQWYVVSNQKSTAPW